MAARQGIKRILRIKSKNKNARYTAKRINYNYTKQTQNGTKKYKYTTKKINKRGKYTYKYKKR